MLSAWTERRRPCGACVVPKDLTTVHPCLSPVLAASKHCRCAQPQEGGAQDRSPPLLRRPPSWRPASSAPGRGGDARLKAAQSEKYDLGNNSPQSSTEGGHGPRRRARATSANFSRPRGRQGGSRGCWVDCGLALAGEGKGGPLSHTHHRTAPRARPPPLCFALRGQRDPAHSTLSAAPRLLYIQYTS